MGGVDVPLQEVGADSSWPFPRVGRILLHLVQRESGLCPQEVPHHSLKRKWELCLPEHGRRGLSHSFPDQGMGETLLDFFRKVYFHSVEQKEWTGFFAPKDL